MLSSTDLLFALNSNRHICSHSTDFETMVLILYYSFKLTFDINDKCPFVYFYEFEYPEIFSGEMLISYFHFVCVTLFQMQVILRFKFLGQIEIR